MDTIFLPNKMNGQEQSVLPSEKILANCAGNECEKLYQDETFNPVLTLNGRCRASYNNADLSVADGDPWTVCFKLGSLLASNGTQYLFGCNTSELVCIASKYLTYKEKTPAWVQFDGSLNSQIIYQEDLVGCITKLSCDGTDIHCWVNQVYKGYITPSSTSLSLLESMGLYGMNFIYPQYPLKGTISNVGLWDSFDDTTGLPAIEDAVFYHRITDRDLTDISGKIVDESGSENHGYLVFDGTDPLAYEKAWGTIQSSERLVDKSLVLEAGVKIATVMNGGGFSLKQSDTATPKPDWSIWYDGSGNELRLALADFLALTNGTKDTASQIKKMGASQTCQMPKQIIYKDGGIAGMNAPQIRQLNRFMGDPSCADRMVVDVDVNGNPILLDDGTPDLVTQEA